MRSGNVLMVCLGNICRSPLAHGIFQHLLNDATILVDSAGTANYHTGASPDIRSIETAKRHHIDISKQKARQFIAEDFDRFDHIFVMDRENLKNVLRLAKTTSQRQKVQLLLGDQEVEDPYYGGPEGFEIIYKKIYTACKTMIEQWNN